jgi:hypothetical protein
VTGTISVSHGKIDLITDVKAVPNPASHATLAGDKTARVWVRYSVPTENLAGIVAKVYNLAGELVWKEDVTNQGQGADPLGKTGAMGTFWWNGRNKNNTMVVPGMYIVVIEANDGNRNVQREVIKIALQ